MNRASPGHKLAQTEQKRKSLQEPASYSFYRSSATLLTEFANLLWMKDGYRLCCHVRPLCRMSWLQIWKVC